MNKHIAFWKKYFYAAALVMSCCFVCSCENDEKEINDIYGKRNTREEATNIESYMSQDGKIKAKLKAPLMYRITVDSQVVEFPKTMHVDFYSDSAKVETWLDCKYGKYYETQDKVYLRDSVIVITVKGDTLKCHDLWWDQSKGTFYTDKYAEYRAKDQDVQGGKGLEATQDLKTVTFKVATGTLQPAQGGFLQ